MSKTVSTETSSDEFLSLHNLVETFSNGLVSLTGTYDSALGQMNLNNVDFSGWNDAVKVNLESSYEELRNASNTISFDISGGSFSRLKECASDLSNLLNDCYEKKVDIDSKNETLSTTPKKINKDITPSGDIIDPATGETRPRMRETIQVPNPAYTNLKNSIDSLVEELQTLINECNTLFAEIAAIEFNNSTINTHVIANASVDNGDSTPAEADSSSNSGYPEGRTLTAREALAERGYDTATIYDESTTYYVVDLDLGSGQQTYYFANEESYQNFMSEREFRQQLVDASRNREPLTINYNGTELTLTEAEFSVPNVGTPTYTQTPYSQLGISLVSSDADWDNNNGNYKFFDSDYEEYSISDILLHGSMRSG